MKARWLVVSLAASLAMSTAVPLGGCTLVRTRVLGVDDGDAGGEMTGETPVPATIDPPVVAPDSFVTLDPVGEAHAVLCRPDDLHPNFPKDADQLTMAFCQDLVPDGVMPTPHGLADVQALLGLSFADPNGANGASGNPAFAILVTDNGATDQSQPVSVQGIAAGASCISGGESHTCAVVAGGGVQCWGWNVSGQLGNGTWSDSATAGPVAGF